MGPRSIPTTMSYVEAYHGTRDLKRVIRDGYIKTGPDGRNDSTLEGYNEEIEIWENDAVFLTDSFREAANYAGKSLPPRFISAVIKVRIPTAWVGGMQYGREHGFGFYRSTWYIVERNIPKSYFIGVAEIP